MVWRKKYYNFEIVKSLRYPINCPEICFALNQKKLKKDYLFLREEKIFTSRIFYTYSNLLVAGRFSSKTAAGKSFQSVIDVFENDSFHMSVFLRSFLYFKFMTPLQM